VLSISSFSDLAVARSQLVTLRARLPQPLHMVVGGKGAPSDLDGIQRLTSHGALLRWAESVRS